ncbi:hypothetical protein FSARC_14670 [Fusarium sarcochroum]|uniref:GH18 domain-containing protein n=1 Tax=Fusarium sarcochroum TaxID=1208366 RepID=A0A8H4WNW4_9HYPO|nr:hypothetical protein FSARC_14670 [Fusarium sarcochroum]
MGYHTILAFGGWVDSTHPTKHHILRNTAKTENRLTVTKNIAAFIKKHDLDGVDIDWEYPGAPDIPDIPKADEDDGKNYLVDRLWLQIPERSESRNGERFAAQLSFEKRQYANIIHQDGQSRVAGPMCIFLGSSEDSLARKGTCTNTAGFIPNAEVDEIANKQTSWWKDESDSDIPVHNDTESVASMSPETKSGRISKYKGLNFGNVDD